MYWKEQKCSRCKYIESKEIKHRYVDKWDIYYHTDEYQSFYLVRHGDNPEDYVALDNTLEEFFKIEPNLD